MANVKRYDKVKLVVSLFSNEKELFSGIMSILKRKFGDIDFESGFLSINKTDYYTNEMGPNLIRKICAFKKLICRDKISDIKVFTNKLEKKFSKENKRRINVDPGYISLGKFILATTKNQQQRIYLRKGIFAECALRYKNGGFISWEWTYPDYASKEYRNTLNTIRELYRKQIR